MNGTDRWQKFAERHQQDERITAPITRTTDFGLFVGLEGGIEGLVHLRDIGWSEPAEAAINRFTEGQLIEALILSIDVDRERVSLGIKQIDSSFLAFADRYTVGDLVVGYVCKIDSKKLIVDLPGGLLGVVRLGSSIPRDVRFEVGKKLVLVVREVSLRRGRISLELSNDKRDSPPVSVEPDQPPSPKPLSTSRNL